jgi:hypothetical protein
VSDPSAVNAQVGELFLTLAVGCFLCGLAGAWVGAHFRGSPTLGWFLGVLFGVFGWGLVLLADDRRRRCPECREVVRPGARRCPHCLVDLLEEAG